MYFFCCTFYSMGFNLNCKASGLLRCTSDSETIPNQKQNICIILLLIKGTEIPPPASKKKAPILGESNFLKEFLWPMEKKTRREYLVVVSTSLTKKNTKGSCGRNSTPPSTCIGFHPLYQPPAFLKISRVSCLIYCKLISIGKPCAPPKFNSSPVKNDGWKTTLLLGCQILRGYVC